MTVSALLLTANVAVDAKGAKRAPTAGDKAALAKRARLLANPKYKEGVKLFQSKNFSGALKCFFQLDANGFCCDLVHYQIGSCYQRTNQTMAAQQHYDWVLAHSKDPTLRAWADYANQTIAYYSAHRTFAGQGNNFDRGGQGGPGASCGTRTGFS